MSKHDLVIGLDITARFPCRSQYVNVMSNGISVCCRVICCSVHAGCCNYTVFREACFDSLCVCVRVCDGIEESSV